MPQRPWGGLLPLFAMLLVSLGLAQSQEFFFRDKDGTMRFSNFSSWKATRDKANPNRFTFRGRAATGELVGVWEKQNLTVRAKAMEGAAMKVGRQTQLEEAVMTGGVTATATRKSAKSATVPQTVVVTAERMDFKGSTNRMDLTGGVTVDQKDPAAESSMNAKSTSGYVILTDMDDKNAKGPVQAASLQGSARITLTSVRMVTERPAGKPAIRRKVTYEVVATASRVEFQLSKSGTDYGTITLVGNVVVTGNDPILFGEMKGYQRVVITLDAELQPVDIEAGEGRGTTTVTQKKGGSGT
ncbi:MAG: hypothetical protein WAO58_05535 [Fimbriimonadaceae bacterium]